VAWAPVRWVENLLSLTRKVHALLESHERTTRAIEKLHDEIGAVKVEMERLKVREEVVIARAEAAAQTAASAVAIHNTADLARRLGGIEAQVNRLPPPHP